ncbi:hypothetical protein [Fusibacter bizertensis]
MLSLIKYEYIKNFCKKKIVFIMISFILINILNIYLYHKTNGMFVYTSEVDQFEDVYWELYDEFSGKIDSDKINKLIAKLEFAEKKIAYNTGSRRLDDPDMLTGSAYLDKLLLSKGYVKPMEYFYLYHDWSNKIVKTSIDNIEFYERYSNLYKVRESRRVAALFSNRKIENFSYLEMYDYYFYYDFSVLLILLFFVYCASGIFITDKEIGFDCVLQTNIKGGQETTFAKLIALILFMTQIAVLFFVTEFCIFNILFKNVNNFSMPLYSVSNYRYTPLEIGIFQFCIIDFFLKLLGFITIGTCCLTISTFFKEIVPAFLTNLLVILLMLLRFDAVMGTGKILLKTINPFALLFNRTLFMNTEFINFLDFPILTYKISLVFAFTLIGFNIFLMFMFTKRNKYLA